MHGFFIHIFHALIITFLDIVLTNPMGNSGMQSVEIQLRQQSDARRKRRGIVGHCGAILSNNAHQIGTQQGRYLKTPLKGGTIVIRRQGPNHPHLTTRNNAVIARAQEHHQPQMKNISTNEPSEHG